MRDIIDNRVEQQRQAKLHKGSAGGITTPYQRIPVSPIKSDFVNYLHLFQLVQHLQIFHIGPSNYHMI